MLYTDDIHKAITWNYPENIPVWVSVLPATWLKYGTELKRLLKDYPQFFPTLPDLDNLEATLPRRYVTGCFTDEWGCVWSNIHEGLDSMVTGHPVKRREDIITLKIPENRDGQLPHGFMYLRILDLRGFEEAMIDFAEEPEELQILLDKIVTYNCYQIEAVLPKADDIMYFGDDLGTQKGLAIGPEKWRKYLKPCFKRMYGMVKAAGKLIYMHTDGCIYEIMPDLAECGVDMINPQVGANGLDNLARVCRGIIPINLDLNRQKMPFSTPSQLDDHVRECVETMYLPQGGLGLNVEFNFDIPLQNIAAVLNAVERYRHYRG